MLQGCLAKINIYKLLIIYLLIVNLYIPLSKNIIILNNNNYLFSQKTKHKIINNSQTIKCSYIYSTSLFARQFNIKSNLLLQYYITNKNHSTIKLISANKNEAIKYQYSTYGKSTRNINNQFTLPNLFQYNGEPFDEHTNLQYLRNRLYNPNLKRFITQDSTDLINHFNYANSNPVNYMDPTGCTAFAALNLLWQTINPLNIATSTVRSLEIITQTATTDAGTIGYAYLDILFTVASLIDPEMEIAQLALTKNNIKNYGVFLGSGCYGKAYLFRGRVYKFLHSDSELAEICLTKFPNDELLQKNMFIAVKKTIRPARRTARFWNHAYNKIYNGLFREYATAEELLIDDELVLSTPPILSKNLSELSLTDEQLINLKCKFDKALAQDAKLILKDSTDDNLKYISINGEMYLLPIDFDQVYNPNRSFSKVSRFITKYNKQTEKMHLLEIKYLQGDPGVYNAY